MAVHHTLADGIWEWAIFAPCVMPCIMKAYTLEPRAPAVQLEKWTCTNALRRPLFFFNIYSIHSRACNNNLMPITPCASYSGRLSRATDNFLGPFYSYFRRRITSLLSRIGKINIHTRTGCTMCDVPCATFNEFKTHSTQHLDGRLHKTHDGLVLLLIGNWMCAARRALEGIVGA